MIWGFEHSGSCPCRIYRPGCGQAKQYAGLTLTPLGDRLIESLTILQERKNDLQNSLVQLENQLAGYGQEILLQQPTLPDKPISPKKFQITLISGMLAGFALLVWSFLRAALRAASDDPECARQFARIRKSFSF